MPTAPDPIVTPPEETPPEETPVDDIVGISAQYLRKTGANIHLVDSKGTEYVWVPNGAGIWIPVKADEWILADSIDSWYGDEDGPVNPSATGAELVAWHKAHLKKYLYGQVSGRLNPPKSGRADCSSLQYYCYKKVMGINIGTYSAAQAGNSKGRVVTTSRSAILHGKGMIPGDLIFYRRPGRRVSHVEMYMGGQRVIGISTPGTRGPRIQALSLQVNYFKGPLKVKRYVKDV